MEGLNQDACRDAVQGEGKAALAPRRAEAARWSSRGADERLKKSSACCFWDLLTGLPSALGASEMWPMKADSGMSKHNTEATQTPCLT